MLFFARVPIFQRASRGFAIGLPALRKPTKKIQNVGTVARVSPLRLFRSTTKGLPLRISTQPESDHENPKSCTPTMSDEVLHEPEQNRFVIKYADVDEPAFISYVLSDGGTVYDINHTYTPPSLRGKGVAGKLVRHVIAFARGNGYKMIPTCSYVAAYMERHPDDKDVLKVD